MIIKKLEQVPFADSSGFQGVTKRIVIGPEDGSDEVVLRYFSVEPGGKSPYHSHDFPHLVKVESGQGVLTDQSGREHPLKRGDYVFVGPNETHSFSNAGEEQFDFICIVPRRGEAGPP
ncbi:MAG: cupin domain-containing protein [Desulfobacteraceae bacterium]